MQMRRGICKRFEQHSRSSPEFDRSLQALHAATVDKSSRYDELMFYANPVPANNFPASLDFLWTKLKNRIPIDANGEPWQPSEAVPWHICGHIRQLLVSMESFHRQLFVLGS
ncbi:unnamed protein product [Sphagnum balticum]